jgi:osmotically-inducible protein OsmY
MNEDRHLQQQVQDEIVFDPSVNAAHVGVTAEKGVVSLSGHVGSLAEKQAAERAARRVRGVKAIASELEVRWPDAKKTADDEIASRAVRMLEWDALIPPNAIKLKVSHGIVTLTGDADWEFQRAEAERDVRRLSGVKSVVNDITLRPQPKPDDIRARIRAAFERSAELVSGSVTVEVHGNRVVLGGQVKNWSERDDAVRAAWSVPGVTVVEEHLLIARP